MRALLAAVFICLFVVAAQAVPAIDGTCATGIDSAGTVITLTQTTTSTNDIIIVGTHNERTAAQGSFATVSTISDTAALTWHLRKRLQLNAGSGSGGAAFNNAEEWWAFSSGALTADAIVITFSTTVDNATAGSCGISGANTTNPFDNNASMPDTNTGIVNSPPTVTAGTTSNTNDMLLGFVFNPTGVSQVGVGTFNAVNATAVDFSINEPAGTNFSNSSMQHLNVAATQSAISFIASTNTATWLAFFDAICQAGGTNCTGGSAAAVPKNILLMGINYGGE
jgi:hypothetical protein